MTAAFSTDLTIFGMYVDRKRICSHLREIDVARLCDIPRDDVRRAIHGKSISTESFLALCEWLERSPSFFDSNELATRREVYP
ncbi:hypothetical protein CN884_07495 [Ochrobactrum sp. 30A/1000/2015]|uniref:hypothetical protein n=1 Tax=Brucella TaxID=234 RepID=UPI000447560C|nr:MULTISPECIES: hypothetical protein [Brucella]PJT24755.1 hypothetical protein CN884_07495 [Ochrobactrum sp. 30A/1000/2015]PJT37038.1 hypothetical protein CN883_20280 [Ochrobactrum sp. 27A/999/2015]PJT45313.1 hypothetical protein CN882_05830 [Ochrobactrum sp. 23A/997/2015]EXL07807.1 hypothetical protein BG46_10880 [Brucella anthropi]MBR7652692.1 hypothetical protein [Brucella oryzae]